MPYDLVFVEREKEAIADAAERSRGGGTVFLSQLPKNPKVFAFFYRGGVVDEAVEKRLSALGEKTGDNLFVDIASLADPDYDNACKLFNIRTMPAIVVTAVSPLAATPDGDTAYVRLDGSSLFARPDDLIRTVEELFNLFLAGKVEEAGKAGWRGEKRAALAETGKRIWAILQPVVSWIASHDVLVDFASAKLEIKESGGH